MADEQGENIPQPGLTNLGSFKPSSFHGDILDALRWKRTFLRYIGLCNLQPQQKCHVLGLSMAGPAEIWFNALPIATRLDWEVLEIAFDEKWITAAHIGIQKQFHTMTCHQTPSESIGDFITRLRTKMDELQYNQQLQLATIIQNLQPHLRAYAVMGLPYVDVDALQNKLINYDLSVKLSADATPKPATAAAAIPPNASAEISKKLEDITKRLDTMTIAATEERQRPTPRFTQARRAYRPPLRCYVCDSPHHLQRSCNQRRPAPSSREFQGRRDFMGPQYRNFQQERNNDRRSFFQQDREKARQFPSQRENFNRL